MLMALMLFSDIFRDLHVKGRGAVVYHLILFDSLSYSLSDETINHGPLSPT